eukprot:2562215-Rhodomonas_salina.2
MVLRRQYAMSSTELGYGAVRCAGLSYAYGAMRCFVLSSGMLLQALRPLRELLDREDRERTGLVAPYPADTPLLPRRYPFSYPVLTPGYAATA